MFSFNSTFILKVPFRKLVDSFKKNAFKRNWQLIGDRRNEFEILYYIGIQNFMNSLTYRDTLQDHKNALPSPLFSPINIINCYEGEVLDVLCDNEYE